MKMKNEALQNLWVRLLTYNSCVPKSFINLFMDCDDAIEGEIAAIKAELTDANLRKDIYHDGANHLRNMAIERGDELRKANKMIDELKEKLNHERKHGEDLADVNGQLASENVDLKARLTLLENSRTGWRSRAQHAEKRVMDLNEKISDLENQLAQARNSTELHLRKENDRLRGVVDTLEKEINTLKKKIHELEEDNETLRSKLEEADIPKHPKRPWHGDGNAMTCTRTCCESLAEAIEFQSKKIEDLKAEKARLKEAYDIHETTIKKENVDLSPGHEFEFGDEVFVPWSDAPYMYVKTGLLYNTRTKRLVYVGKDQHLKWFGEKFAIV